MIRKERSSSSLLFVDRTTLSARHSRCTKRYFHPSIFLETWKHQREQLTAQKALIFADCFLLLLLPGQLPLFKGAAFNPGFSWLLNLY
jgi:hypothetical protein